MIGPGTGDDVVPLRTRWESENGDGHSQWLVDRFRQMAAEGADLAGEARLLDAMIAPGASVLDAGCGSGRVGAELARRGHPVVGVDADALLVAAAVEDHPGGQWLVGDLTGLDLGRVFDAAILAGNVLPYLAPGTEVTVLERVKAHVREEGLILLGFGTGRGYAVESFAGHVIAAGLREEQRFATWDLRPWRDGGDYLVSVLRHG